MMPRGCRPVAFDPGDLDLHWPASKRSEMGRKTGYHPWEHRNDAYLVFWKLMITAAPSLVSGLAGQWAAAPTRPIPTVCAPWQFLFPNRTALDQTPFLEEAK